MQASVPQQEISCLLAGWVLPHTKRETKGGTIAIFAQNYLGFRSGDEPMESRFT